MFFMEFGQLILWTSRSHTQIVYAMHQQERFLSALVDIGWWLQLRHQASVLEGRGVRHTAVWKKKGWYVVLRWLR